MTRHDLNALHDSLATKFERLLLTHLPSPAPSPGRNGYRAFGEEESFADIEDNSEDGNDECFDTPIRKKRTMVHRDTAFLVFQVSH